MSCSARVATTPNTSTDSYIRKLNMQHNGQQKVALQASAVLFAKTGVTNNTRPCCNDSMRPIAQKPVQQQRLTAALTYARQADEAACEFSVLVEATQLS
jgi:hypothetical protein